MSMSPRFRLLSVATKRTATLPTRPLLAVTRPGHAASRWNRSCVRWMSQDEKPRAAEFEEEDANTDQLEGVSEEAAEIGKITGVGGPELEQGTPIQEMLEREESLQDTLPKIMLEEMKKRRRTNDHNRLNNSKPSQSNPFKPLNPRSFSTLARRRNQEPMDTNSPTLDSLLSALTSSETKTAVEAPSATGHKFPLPDVAAMPRTAHLKHRYDPLVEQMTKSMMRDGKLTVAQKNMAQILNSLRTSSPPNLTILQPLLPHPPAHALPLNPIQYLELAIDSLAPLIRMQQLRGIAGGGATLPMPTPLNVRQRRHTAISWILDVCNKRGKSTGGLQPFPKRVADELIAVVEGRSSCWERRHAVHKLAVAARSNVGRKFTTHRRLSKKGGKKK